jgi:hypothetical protein
MTGGKTLQMVLELERSSMNCYGVNEQAIQLALEIEIFD